MVCNTRLPFDLIGHKHFLIHWYIGCMKRQILL